MAQFSILTVLFIQSVVMCANVSTSQEEIFKQFERLQTEVQRLRHLESEVESLRNLQSKVQILESDVQGIGILESEVQHLRQENKQLKEKLNELNVKRNGKSGKIQDHKQTKRLIQNERNSELVSSATAFSAVLTPKFDKNIGQLHVFVYDKVESNFGGAYNNNSGLFTAPKPGIYAFLWTIVAEGVPSNYGEISTELVVNSVVRGRAFTDTEVANDDDQATGFIIVQLNQGDVVFVRSIKGIPQGVLQSYHQGGWTFSGWQIA